MKQRENDFQSQVMALAKLCGWLVVHFKTVCVNRGGRRSYETPYDGDGGFPDLVIARRGVVLHVELKTDTGRLSQDQKHWLEAMGDSGRVWRPRDWDEIEKELK